MLFPIDRGIPDPEQLKSLLKINQRSCPFVKHIDAYTVKYLGKGLMHTDVASIQTIKPASKEDFLFYFEVKIIEIGQRGDICIGFADKDFPSNKHPGYTKNSFGYKADGKTYCNKVASILGFPKYNSEDIVGCGLNFLKKEIFFTLNGSLLGTPFKNVELCEFFPTIGLHSPNESIKFNFDWKFKLSEYREKELVATREQVLSLEVNSFQIHQIVHSYLYQHGHYQTLECFEKVADLSRENTVMVSISSEEKNAESGQLNGSKVMEIEAEFENVSKANENTIKTNENMTNENEVKSIENLHQENQENQEEHHENGINKSATLAERTNQKDRDWLRECVNKGELDSVRAFLSHQYPSLLEDKSLGLALSAQQFLEFVRKGEISSAIALAQHEFPGNEEETLEFIDYNGKLATLKLEELMGILCYERPEHCTLGYLLETNQREILAEKLNSAVLGSLKYNKKSVLEVLLSHYMVLNQKNMEVNCYLGNIFDSETKKK